MKDSKSKGITLIALIITIIILLILTGILISSITENGLFSKTKASKDEYQKKAYLEELELEKTDYMTSKISKLDFEYKVLEFLDHAIADKTFSQDDVGDYNSLNEETIHATVKMGKFLYTVTKKEEDGNIYINYSGEDGEKDNSLSKKNVDLSLEWIEVPELKNIKKPKITIIPSETGVTTQYMVGKYDIENENVTYLTDWIDGDTVLQFTQLDGNSSYLDYGYIVYGQMTDGKNTSQIASIFIEDNVAPKVSVISKSAYSDQITVSIKSEDNEAGMPSKVLYDYYIAKEGEEYPENPEAIQVSLTSYTFTGLMPQINYNIKVVTHDLWGNEGYVEVTQKTASLPYPRLEVIWSGGEVDGVNISYYSQNYYHIQYQVNSYDDDGWKSIASGTVATDVAYGDVFYARCIDNAGNIGSMASLNIIDDIDPDSSIHYNGEYNISENDPISFDVSQYDSGVGVDITKCRWIFSPSYSYITEYDYLISNGNQFSDNYETIYPDTTIPSDMQGMDVEFYLIVLTVDYKENYYIKGFGPIVISPNTINEGDIVLYNVTPTSYTYYSGEKEWSEEGEETLVENTLYNSDTIPTVVINKGGSDGMQTTVDLLSFDSYGISLYGQYGYDNAVNILNEAVSTLFTNNEKGIYPEYITMYSLAENNGFDYWDVDLILRSGEDYYLTESPFSYHQLGIIGDTMMLENERGIICCENGNKICFKSLYDSSNNFEYGVAGHFMFVIRNVPIFNLTKTEDGVWTFQ